MIAVFKYDFTIRLVGPILVAILLATESAAFQAFSRGKSTPCDISHHRRSSYSRTFSRTVVCATRSSGFDEEDPPKQDSLETSCRSVSSERLELPRVEYDKWEDWTGQDLYVDMARSILEVSWAQIERSDLRKRISRRGPKFYDYEECRKWAHAQNMWTSREEWMEWIELGEKKNSLVPSCPESVYSEIGTWVSWEDFLGTWTIY